MLSGRTQEQKIIALSDIISYKTNKLWQSFAHSKLDLECKRREKCELHVTRVGLANTLEIRCTYRSQRCDGHSWTVQPPSNLTIRPSHNKAYHLNTTSILAAHQAGMGWKCTRNFLSYDCSRLSVVPMADVCKRRPSLVCCLTSHPLNQNTIKSFKE